MTEEVPQDMRLARMAAVLCAAPIFGAVITAWGMMQAFEDMGPMPAGDPGVLRQKIGGTLFPVAVGLVLAIVGLPLALRCIFGKGQRPWWLVLATSFASFLLAWVVIHGTWIFLTRS